MCIACPATFAAMPVPTNAIPPMAPIPPTKAAHKQALFDSCKALVGIALSYTIKYTYDPEELDFIDFLNDVIKTLPMDERTVPVCALLLFQNMAHRSEGNQPRVVELVDESLPAPQPVRMHCSDGTSTMIEQVKTNSSKLRLSPNTAFEFKGNTPSVLPVPVPYTLTFTPKVIKSKPSPVLPPMSYDVLASGKFHERDVALRFDDENDEHERQNRSFGVPQSAEPLPMTLATPSTSGRITEQAPTPEFPVPTAPTESMDTIPAAQTSTRFKSSKMAARTAAKHQIAPSSAAAIPSMASASSSDLPASSTDIPAKMDASSAPDVNEDYPFAVNHFPPHPHASDGRPPAGRRAGLQRSYAFTHKSHPEIFWNDAWGERPTEGQAPPAEGRLHLQTDSPKGKMKSDKQSERERPISGRSNSPVRIPSSGSAMRAMMQLASKKQGKKRAREELDADENEERPNQRRRASGDGFPKRSSRSLSGLWKKALSSVTELPFAKQ